MQIQGGYFPGETVTTLLVREQTLCYTRGALRRFLSRNQVTGDGEDRLYARHHVFIFTELM